MEGKIKAEGETKGKKIYRSKIEEKVKVEGEIKEKEIKEKN